MTPLVVVAAAAGIPAVAIALAPASSALAVPMATSEAGVTIAVAGALAAIRVATAGPRALLLAAGLALWAAAGPLGGIAPPASAVGVIAGSCAIGGWISRSSTTRLLARFVTAFVSTLLVVVLSLAGVLAGVGSAALESEQLRVLADAAQRSTDEVIDDWPRSAVLSASVLTESFDQLRAIADGGTVDDGLGAIRRRLFADQDFLALLDANGSVLSLVSDVEGLDGGGFDLALSGAEAVGAVLAGEAQAGGVVTTGNRVVGLGAAGIEAPDSVPEEPPELVAVTGRIADDVWATRTASVLGAELSVGIVVEVGGEVSATGGVPEGIDPDLILGRSGEGQVAAADQVVFVGSAEMVDPTDGRRIGSIVAARTSAAITGAERDQTRILFVTALLGAVLAGSVVALVAARVVRPIRRLTTAADAVREGDLAASSGVQSPDEVGVLGRAFDEMTSSLLVQSTRLRDAAASQSRLRARLEALTESMGDALVAVDPSGAVITFNPAAEALIDTTADAVLGRHLDDVLIGEDASGAPAAAALGSPVSEHVVATRLVLARADGARVPTAATAAPVRGARRQVLGRVLVLRDVTRDAQVERMKSEFLSNVSHELRTPLTPIKGYAEVLARRSLSAQQSQRFATEILDSTQRLERIVGLIVDFAGLDSGRLQVRHEVVDLRALIGGAMPEWRDRWPDRELRRRLAVDLPAVHGDATMLRRCLDELIDNAVKFSPGGEPVSITAEVTGDEVCLSVRDRGVGMEVQTATGIFLDFHQVDASETRQFGGLGLGLALVRRIVDGLGATIDIESAPEGGTSVHLRLEPHDLIARDD